MNNIDESLSPGIWNNAQYVSRRYLRIKKVCAKCQLRIQVDIGEREAVQNQAQNCKHEKCLNKLWRQFEQWYVIKT